MTPAIPGGGFNWLPQRLWGILRATCFFLHIIIQTFVFTDCPWFTPEAKIIELRTVKDLSLAERCPAVKIMSLEEAFPGIWRWWIHDRTTNGLGFHFGGQMVLVIEIGICTSWRRLTWWSLTRFSLVAVDVQLDLDSSMSSEWVLAFCRLAFDVPASRNKSCLWHNSVLKKLT